MDRPSTLWDADARTSRAATVEKRVAAIGTNQMPCSIVTTATYLIFSGEDDLIDSCSGIAGKVLRGCRIGSQAHSVALSLHNPNSIGLIVPFLRRVPEPKAAIR